MHGFKHCRGQWGLLGGSAVKNLLALKEMQEKKERNAGDLGSVPGSGRSPGGANTNPLQYSQPGEPHGQRRLAGYSP